jgi:hypothetical protein
MGIVQACGKGPVSDFMIALVSARLRTAFALACAAMLTAAGGPLTVLPTWAPPPDQSDLLNSLAPRLPANWHMGQPYDYLGVPYVRVQIQDEWRGNPVAAAVSMCPGPENAIWNQTRVIRLVMRYRQHDWPAYECRP